MIKCVGHSAAGVPALMLGLTDGNLELLRSGQPILLELTGLGLPWGEGVIAIFHGKTTADIEQMLRENGMITPETQIKREEQGT
jgi:hypothetical protein